MKPLPFNHYWKLAILIFYIFAFSNCEKEQNQPVEPIQALPEEGMIKLGKKLENPFTVENVKKAYHNLVQNGLLKSDIEITATHQYIRLLPSSMEEFDMLELDTLNVMFDYPLDYELEEGGTYYFDPLLDPTENPITWQYLVFPINQPLPQGRVEILADLVLELSVIEKNNAPQDSWALIENEALRITGNLQEEEFGSKTRWRPSGTITVYDSLLRRQIPIQGVKIRARWWFFYNIGLTDASGKFEVNGTFKSGRKVNYCIIWERDYWDIRDGFLVQAYFNGPTQNTPWNLNIEFGGKSVIYATIHRALYRYFYKDVQNLRRPYNKPSNMFRLKVAFRDGSGTGVYWSDIDNTGFTPHIQVWGKDIYNKYKSTNIIFAITIHELAHHAHCIWMGNIQYWQVIKVIYESWATAVEWRITNLEYNELGNNYNVSLAKNYNHEYGRQTWTRGSSNWEYSPIFIDLIDSFNQRNSGLYGTDWHYGSSNYPNDTIVGYSMEGLNNILINIYNLSSLSNALKNNKPIGITDSQIDELFLLY